MRRPFDLEGKPHAGIADRRRNLLRRQVANPPEVGLKEACSVEMRSFKRGVVKPGRKKRGAFKMRLHQGGAFQKRADEKRK